jgi:hypothetical protein
MRREKGAMSYSAEEDVYLLSGMKTTMMLVRWKIL